MVAGKVVLARSLSKPTAQLTGLCGKDVQERGQPVRNVPRLKTPAAPATPQRAVVVGPAFRDRTIQRGYGR